MEELRNQEGTGGTKPQREVEFVEIELDADTRIRPATSMATDAGTDYGLKIKKKLEEDRRRTLRVGGLTVKLPYDTTGTSARGTLSAEVRRVSESLAKREPEPLSAKMRRVAAFMDRSEGSKRHMGEKKKRRRTEDLEKLDRPPPRRRRHLSAH